MRFGFENSKESCAPKARARFIRAHTGFGVVMKTVFAHYSEAGVPASETTPALPVRERVLRAALEMFAEAGFNGTHLREICKRAGTNVAGVCYHFHSKEGLYEAVLTEAGRRLSEHDYNFVLSKRMAPEQKLLKLVESLLKRLRGGRAWLARLLGRELVDASGVRRNFAAYGLERDFVLMQSAIRDLPGAKRDMDEIRLDALTLIAGCVFYSAIGENRHHPLGQFASELPRQANLAPFLTNRLLRSLANERLSLNSK
jgi:AcrR family transcriptional regulator